VGQLPRQGRTEEAPEQQLRKLNWLSVRTETQLLQHHGCPSSRRSVASSKYRGPVTDSRPVYAPMETLLSRQTTADDKMIPPSRCLLHSQSAGGRNVSAVRSLSSDSSSSRRPQPATEGRPVGGPQLPRLHDHTGTITAGVIHFSPSSRDRTCSNPVRNLYISDNRLNNIYILI
jgi:hypothetical protein